MIVNKQQAYFRAEKKVKAIKSFYTHLFFFIAFNIVWWLLLSKIEDFVVFNIPKPDKGFFNWVDINTWLTPGIWAVILFFHGLSVFTNVFNIFRNWEERKINEYMKEGNEIAAKNQWE